MDAATVAIGRSLTLSTAGREQSSRKFGATRLLQKVFISYLYILAAVPCQGPALATCFTPLLDYFDPGLR